MTNKIVSMLLLCSLTVNTHAQNNDPKGLYKLKEIVHQDGTKVVPNFIQYKYCGEGTTLQIWHNLHGLDYDGSVTFSMRNVDGQPLKYTGKLSDTEDRGAQIFGNDSNSFVLRWFSNMQNNYNFPYHTNIDELYQQTNAHNDKIFLAMEMLGMNLGTGQKELKGVWKLRGKQKDNCATSQYFVQEQELPCYKVFSDSMSLTINIDSNFPVSSATSCIKPCSHLNDNAVDENGTVSIIHWFDYETISTTSYDKSGMPVVLIWDKCGLPNTIQTIFQTSVPQLKKDISRYTCKGFEDRYGAQPDSIMKAYESYSFLVEQNEKNNAIFPILMKAGFLQEYTSLKDSLMKRMMQGEISAKEAVSHYVYWFYKNFDRHTNIGTSKFWQMADADKAAYSNSIKEYSPKPMACKIDEETYFVRIPSCMGDYPTEEWVDEKVKEYKQSGCKYLIIDVRGNGGGSDGVGYEFYSMLGDCGGKRDVEYLYRNSFDNLTYSKNVVKKYREYERSLHHSAVENNANDRDSDFLTWIKYPVGFHKFEPEVKKGAVIMDSRTASAGETYIYFVKNYSKTHARVYGKDNSAGCEQTGNVNLVSIPHIDARFIYPLTVIDSFSELCKKKKPGHSPDVIIPLPYPEKLTDNIDEWVLWVAKDLKKRKF